jgi:hypothetical protein
VQASQRFRLLNDTAGTVIGESDADTYRVPRNGSNRTQQNVFPLPPPPVKVRKSCLFPAGPSSQVKTVQQFLCLWVVAAR